jgi:hypothetical protein
LSTSSIEPDSPLRIHTAITNSGMTVITIVLVVITRSVNEWRRHAAMIPRAMPNTIWIRIAAIASRSVFGAVSASRSKIGRRRS